MTVRGGRAPALAPGRTGAGEERKNRLLAAALAALSLAGAAPAQETLKIGLVLPHSGRFADPAAQMDAGVKLYMQLHGDMVAGRKIEIVRKDTGGIAPDVAKRLAEALVVRDRVDIRAGNLLTPNALAIADISKDAETFMVVMNAATTVITTKSPYMARVSLTTARLNHAFGKWVAGTGVRRIYTMVTDHGPGTSAGEAFEMAFRLAGGAVIGADRTPVVNPDFSPFVQRVADAKPEALHVRVPGGTRPPALGKALAERGATPATTKIFGQGEPTDAAALKAMGEVSLGTITAYHYNVSRSSPENDAFVAAYKAANGGRAPDIHALGGHDGMHLICEALRKTGGKAEGPALIAAAKGMAWESPRGPVRIDPATREIVQTVWISAVQMVNGEPTNVIIASVPEAKDPILSPE